MIVNGINLSSADDTEEELLVPEGTDNIIIDSQEDVKNKNVFTHIDTTEEAQEDKLSTLKKEKVDLDEMSIAFKVKSEEGEDILSLSEVEQSLTDGGVASKSLVEYIEREHGDIVGDGIALEHYSVRPSKTGYTALLNKVRQNIAKESMEYSKNLNDVLEKSLKLLNKQVRHSAEDILPLLHVETSKLSHNLQRCGDDFPNRVMFSVTKISSADEETKETYFEDLYKLDFSKTPSFKAQCELMLDKEEFISSLDTLFHTFSKTPMGAILIESHSNPSRPILEIFDDKEVKSSKVGFQQLLDLFTDSDTLTTMLYNAVECIQHNDASIINSLNDIKDKNESGTYVVDLKANVALMSEVSKAVIVSSRLTMFIQLMLTTAFTLDSLVTSIHKNYT